MTSPLFKNLVIVLLVLSTILKVGLFANRPMPIVNVHESIERYPDIATLLSVMDFMDMDKTILHEIPLDILQYNPDPNKGPDLSKLGTTHEDIAGITEMLPSYFDFFCALSNFDETLLEEVQQCIDLGALGIKLYNGYSYAHDMELNSPSLDPLYQKMEEQGLILMMPVNLSLYGEEFEDVLRRHPEMKVIAAHYGLSSKTLERIDALMDEYPNLYVDTSFGHIDFAEDGFETISNNHEAFEVFFVEHQDRILFATDNVVTSYEEKDADWILDLYGDYLSILQEGEFQSKFFPDKTYQGLELPIYIQHKVFWRNWGRLVN